MELTGAQIVIECLKEQGVDTIFGYPGGAILNVYDELYKHKDEIRHILTSHEQGASHAADGYARSTGKVGVCMATSGPGATNLVTGIATAYMDSVPLVAITCNVGVPLLGKDSFQEVDIAGITTPITKHNFIVKDVEKLADTIRRAFAIARRGRPGPVLVDIPKDVTGQKAEYVRKEIAVPEQQGGTDSGQPEQQGGAVSGQPGRQAETDGGQPGQQAETVSGQPEQPLAGAISGQPEQQGRTDGRQPEQQRAGTVSDKPEQLLAGAVSERELETALEMIRDSRKPYIFVGGGAVISDASAELKEFVEKVQAPVCDTLMGKGAFDGRDEKYTGMLGMHGTKASNYGVSECDLLIALGTRFSDRVTGNAEKFAHQAKILQIDIDPAEINKNILVDASVIGDVREVLSLLNGRLEQQEHAEWLSHIMEYSEKYPMTYPAEGLNGPYMMETIYKKTGGDATIVAEVGQHQMWAAQFYRYKSPRMLITSGGLGTMGYGLGAAIGVQVANPDRTVINVAGDGCFRMNMNELATAVREKLPLVEIIVNNHVLGMVRQWQDLFYGKRYSATVLDDGMDYVKVAEAMGAAGYRAASREEFDRALDLALQSRMPVVIDCIIGRDEKVWPMVAPGAAIDEVFTAEDMQEG